MVVLLVMLVHRFKNVHKRKADLENVARLGEEEHQLDEFTSPRHEPSFGDSDFAAAGGSGVGTRVGFEAPSRPKSSRREATFSYQSHPQVKPALFFLASENSRISETKD